MRRGRLVTSQRSHWLVAAIVLDSASYVTQMSIMMVRALIAAVERAGVGPARFIEAAGITSAQLDDLDVRIPIVEFRRLARAALSVTGDPALGLHMGEHMRTGTFDVIGHLSEQSTCLRDAILVGVRYSRIVSENSKLELCEASDTALLRINLPKEDGPEIRMASEVSAMALLRLVRSFVGWDAKPRRAFFAYQVPAYHAEYTRAFGPDIRFAHAFTALEIDRVWLDQSFSDRPTELRNYLQSRAESLLAKVEHDAPAAERVKRWLASRPAPTRPTMEQIAHELGTSARSLRRRLRDERAQFSTLVDEAISGHAKRMLADPHRSIQETAFALGFTTPSAFSRAFKRWTGMAPREFRAER